MSHDCQAGTCSSKEKKESLLEKPNQLSKIKKVIGVASGKGGVGKSFVTGMLAVSLNKKGYKTGILDADITGPSIPKMFGISQKVHASELGIFPEKTKDGINIMSINLVLAKEDDPVIWRGPILAGTVKQFWTDVMWGELDFLFIDLPPGTGDVPLTVFQSIPLDGIIIVASPQDLVSMIVKKAFNMANLMHIPVIGAVENMSYLKCPDCNKEIKIFGESKLEETAKSLNIPLLDRIPIDPEIASLADKGTFEQLQNGYLDNTVKTIEEKFIKK